MIACRDLIQTRRGVFELDWTLSVCGYVRYVYGAISGNEKAEYFRSAAFS